MIKVSKLPGDAVKASRPPLIREISRLTALISELIRRCWARLLLRFVSLKVKSPVADNKPVKSRLLKWGLSRDPARANYRLFLKFFSQQIHLMNRELDVWQKWYLTVCIRSLFLRVTRWRHSNLDKTLRQLMPLWWRLYQHRWQQLGRLHVLANIFCSVGIDRQLARHYQILPLMVILT